MATDPPVILIAGAAGHLGRAVASRLAPVARLALADRLADPAGILPAGAVAAAHLPLPGAELLDEAGCAALCRATLARFGRIDGVVHTVGGFAAAPIDEAGPALWEQMFRLNLLSPLHLFRAAVPAMRAQGSGSLVATGAMAALRSPAGLAAYSASKAGVLRLVESLADELRPTGIRVNAVLPGTIDTPPNRAAMPDADVRLWVTVAEIAEVVAFLVSPAASGVTGALVPVTGRS